ncbi:MAG: hypothetical protein HYS12_19935 [Planctomycetes bacterium]|nr:hypothetical protein [Planctomycetota bacterium]
MTLPSTLTPIALFVAMLTVPGPVAVQPPKERNYPYRELEGVVEEFHFTRNWRHYYWREDFTMLVRDNASRLHRVISREPTPWAGYRLGTTYTGLAVDWTGRPRVRVVGVGAVDRIPAEFYDLKLDPDRTTTALIVRVRRKGSAAWDDFYVNNWFHRWGADADRKVLAHYANAGPHYTVYGYLGGTLAPLDETGKKLLAHHPDAGLFHGRIAKAGNVVGYELRLLHLLGRDRKTQKYEVMYGDPKELARLDGNAPPEPRRK